MCDIGFFGEIQQAAGVVEGLGPGGARQGVGGEGEDEQSALGEGGLPWGLEFHGGDTSGAAPDERSPAAQKDVSGVLLDGRLEGTGDCDAGVAECPGLVVRGEDAVRSASRGAEEGDFAVFQQGCVS